MRVNGIAAACLAPIVLVVLATLGSCASEQRAEGPGGTVQEFYDHLNDGSYARAKALYSAEALAVIDDPDAAEDTFATWAEGQTKGGTISEVRILSTESAEGTARVQFELRYRDGTSRQESVALVEENGSWKLGLVG